MEFKMLIGGDLVAGSGTMDVINPATAAVISQCPRGTAVDINAAVAAAKGAFPAWSELSVAERSQVLLKIADVVDANVDELARLITLEGGCPLEFTKFEAAGLAASLRYFAGLSLPETLIENSTSRRVRLVRRSLGVVAAITPWNFPFDVIGVKLPPALMAGNTVVLKPAGTTPLASLHLGRLIARIVPPGVVNVVSDANDLGDILTQHPDVRKVSFTGSTATGRRVMANAAATLKRLTLELGGNDAAIVLDDADLKKIATDIAFWAFFHAGQVCIGLKRLYVHASIYDSMCEELVAIAGKTVVGDGLTAGTQLGPLQNLKQFERALEYIADGRKHGKVIAGGERLPGPGYFIPPTVVRDITDGSRLVDEEQFCPVLPVIKYTEIDEVIRGINTSSFGLGGSVWSSDPSRALAVAERLNVGMVWINKHCDVATHIPFAGSKASGVGVEFGQEGLLDFTQIHIINEPAAQAT